MRQVGGWKPSEVKIHTLGMVIHKWENDYHFSNSPQRVRGLSPTSVSPFWGPCIWKMSLQNSSPEGPEDSPSGEPVQFSSVTQSCPTLWDPMNRSMPGLPVHHQLPEFTQTHVHRVIDAIQPSHPLSSPSPAPNPSQQQNLFQCVNFLHEVAKVLEFQL